MIRYIKREVLRLVIWVVWVGALLQFVAWTGFQGTVVGCVAFLFTETTFRLVRSIEA